MCFPRSFSIFIILSYEMERPSSGKHSVSFLVCTSLCTCIPYRNWCFNHFYEILVGKSHVLYLSIFFTSFKMICVMFSVSLPIEFFFRIVSIVCFGSAMIHLSNYDNETYRSNPEKLQSNFQFDVLVFGYEYFLLLQRSY